MSCSVAITAPCRTITERRVWPKQRIECECASEYADMEERHNSYLIFRLAVEKTSTWLMVDAWESLQDEYQRTAVVLDHFDEEINGGPSGGVLLSDGSRRRIRVMLLAGGDLIQSMGEPGVWADADVCAPPSYFIHTSHLSDLVESYFGQVWLHDRRTDRCGCVVFPSFP